MLADSSASMNTWPMSLHHRPYHHLHEGHNLSYTTPLEVHEEDPLPPTPKLLSRDRSFGHFKNRNTPSRASPKELRSFGTALLNHAVVQDGDDLLSVYESALRRHFTSQDGWIVTRNYPFKVFAEGFCIDEPSFSIPFEEEPIPAAVDIVSHEGLDLSTLALVVEHVSSPGEPVLILDLHDTPAQPEFDDVDDFLKRRSTVLLDIMGWQLNDVDRGFVITAHGTSWSGASIHRGGKARSASTEVFNLSHESDLDGSSLAWIDWALSELRHTSGSLRQNTVFEDVRDVKSHKAFATMAALIEDGLPPYSQLEYDDSPSAAWPAFFVTPPSDSSGEEEDIWQSLRQLAPFGSIRMDRSSSSLWSSSDSDEYSDDYY